MSDLMKIVLYEDYVDDLPSSIMANIIKSNTADDEAPSKHGSYHYVLTHHIEPYHSFIETQAYRNEPDGEEDTIVFYVPENAIKCIIQSKK